MELHKQHVPLESNVPKNLLPSLDLMKKLATPLHCLLSRACKSNVLEVLETNDVSSSNKSDSSKEEDVGEITRSHQEIDV